METPNNNPEVNLHDDVANAAAESHNQGLAAEQPQHQNNVAEDGYTEKKLRKIRPNLHHNGKYRMFSNYSSSNDIPKTSTGI